MSSIGMSAHKGSLKATAFFLPTRTATPVNLSQKDSTLEQQYKKAETLFENKKYVESLRLAFALYEQTKNNKSTKIHYLVTNLIAKIYRQNKEHKKAVVFYKKSVRLILLNTSYNKDLGSFNNRDYTENLLRLGGEYQLLKMNDSAIFYYYKLAKLNSLTDEVLGFQASSYSNLAGIYQKDTTMLNHYEKAVEFSEKAIAIHKKRNKRLSQASAINNLANVYLLQGNFEKSKKKYFEGIKLIKRDTSSLSISIKADLYYNLAWAMRNLKEYEAYDYQEISYDMEDELRDDEMTQNIKRITGEYNVDVVRKAGEFEKQKAENLTWIIGISSVAIILLLAFFLNQYKLRQQNLSLQLINKETASQLEVLNATLAGEETARKQISQELHDGILGKLFGSRMGLGYLELQASTETQLKYESLLNELQHIEQEIRDVSHKLHYNFSSIEVYFIKNIDLQLQEKSLLGNFSYKLQIDKKLSWENIASDIKLELYRILQECFQNILKHAKPSKVLLDFKLANKQLLVELVDDGIGFNTNQQFKGIGLKNIQVRAEKIGGSIQVLSEKTKGTTVQIKIPMSEYG
ncbi:ATP-binding protein [Flavobacteriaceae bacterium]|nr:ATP-binding protein [Flavobacteriaceae bacterium]